MKRRAMGVMVVVAVAPFVVACVIDLSRKPQHAAPPGSEEAGVDASAQVVPSASAAATASASASSTSTASSTPTASASALPTPAPSASP